MTATNPKIQIDTREQRPLVFDAAFETEVVGLPMGDYGIAGFSTWSNPAFIVERKSLADLVSSLTHERERFMRECEGLRRFRFACILVEAHEADVIEHRYRSQTAPESILQSLAALQARAGLHVIWAGDAAGAARTLERLVRQFCRGIEKDYKRLLAGSASATTKKEIAA